MIKEWAKMNDQGTLWIQCALGHPLPEPEGFRWPNTSAHARYYAGTGYDCHANFYTPEQFMGSVHVNKWGPYLAEEQGPR